MNLEHLLPYAFILLLAGGILAYIKRYADRFLQIRTRELDLLSRQHKPEKNSQAYERMLLFLERIKPAYLISRFDRSLSPDEFVFLAEKSIREEFEYNLSQQLYVAPEVWSKVVNAKNSTILLVHETLEKLEEPRNLVGYHTLLLMKAMESPNKIAEAIVALQHEINS